MEVLIFFAVIWAIVKYSQASEAKKKEYRAKLQKAYERMREEAQKNSRNLSNKSSYTSSTAQAETGSFEYGETYRQTREMEKTEDIQTFTPRNFENQKPIPDRHVNNDYILHRSNHEKCVSRNNDTPTIVRPKRFWGNAEFD